jgi:hypothetical protein
MQGRDQGNVPEEVSFISTQLSGRYVSGRSGEKQRINYCIIQIIIFGYTVSAEKNFNLSVL